MILMQLVELAEEAYDSLGGDIVLADCPYGAHRGHASCTRCLLEALYGIGPAGLAELCERRRWAELTAAVSGQTSDSSPAFVGLQSICTILRAPEGGDTEIGAGDEGGLAELVWEPGFPRRE